MAREPDAATAKGKGFTRGGRFRQAGALVEAQIRAASGRRHYVAARIAALWPEIVGPEIASVASPLRFQPARGPAGGTLALGVVGANGPQVQMLSPLIRERVNAAMGHGVVGRVQIARQGLPEPPPAARPCPESMDLGALEPAVSSIGDAELRRELETLARNVLSRAQREMRS